MNPELLKKLVEDLKKTGFASELRAIKRLNQLEWSCRAGHSYLDKDENKTREIDIIAHTSDNRELPSGKFASAFFFLVAEVKKTESPWIVFRRDLGEYEGCAWNNLIWCKNLPADPTELYPAIAQRSLLRMMGWQGTGIHQAFKDPDAPSRWYSAFTTVCKAAEQVLERNSYAMSDDRSVAQDVWEYPTSFNFVQPLVILEGPLFSASIDDAGEPIIQPVKAAPFLFEFQTKNYTRGSYRVDLITLDHVKEYSRLARSRLKDILDVILALAKVKPSRAIHKTPHVVKRSTHKA